MKIIKPLLVNVLLFLVTTAAYAQTNGDTGPLHWEYNPDDFTLTISGSGIMPDYAFQVPPWNEFIPSVKYVNIETGVLSIGNRAFANCTSLLEVTMPNSIVMIGGAVFLGCSSLTAIIIPNLINTIGDYTFAGCSSLTAITIPNSVNSIGSYAFYGCTSSTEVTIGNSVRKIGNYAFNLCTSLTEVTIPNSVIEIGTSTFMECTSLTSVIIPNSVTTIGIGAFAGCTVLEEVINHAQTPQTVNANVFQNVTQSACTLYVPAASVVLYQAADVWKNFGTILAISGTGIDEVLTKNISIFPNPVRNELNIENGELNIEKVEIMDLSGKIVSTFNNLENKINVSTLSTGIYFIKINTDKGVVAEKFVKE